jgi:hypothetical protein
VTFPGIRCGAALRRRFGPIGEALFCVVGLCAGHSPCAACLQPHRDMRNSEGSGSLDWCEGHAHSALGPLSTVPHRPALADRGIGEPCGLEVFFRFRVTEPPEGSMSELLLLGGFCVPRHLLKRDMASHSRNLIGRASRLSKPPSSRFS